MKQKRLVSVSEAAGFINHGRGSRCTEPSQTTTQGLGLIPSCVCEAALGGTASWELSKCSQV